MCWLVVGVVCSDVRLARCLRANSYHPFHLLFLVKSVIIMSLYLHAEDMKIVYEIDSYFMY